MSVIAHVSVDPDLFEIQLDNVFDERLARAEVAPAVPRQGAYDYGPYRRGMDGTEDARLGAGILAIKAELVFTGTERAVKPWLPKIGDATVRAIEDVQRKASLPVTGEGNPDTLMALFRPRIEMVSEEYGLPPAWLGKKSRLEGAGDPVAIGQEDPDDLGFNQINVRIHKSVTRAQAFTPAFSIPWAARYLVGLKAEVERRIDTWRAALAGYNIGPHYAALWAKAGFPESGLVVTYEDGRKIDWFARAHNYTKHVLLANF